MQVKCCLYTKLHHSSRRGADEQVWGASGGHDFGARFAWLAVDDIGKINQLSAFKKTITNWGVTVGKMKRLILSIR